jgi:hypothetical protein
MPDMEESRLGRLMDERRLNLGLDWQDVASLAGISTKTLYNARVPGGPLPAPRTRRKIEDVLRWQPGSMERVHGGGDPEPLPVPVPLESLAARYPGVPVSERAGDPDDDDAARLFPGDTRHRRLIRNIWRLGQAYDTPPKERIDMIEVVDPGLAAALRDVGAQSEAGLSLAPRLHVQSQAQCNNSDTSRVSGSHRTVPVRHE